MTVENTYFTLFKSFDDFIANHIVDINSTRADRTDPKTRRWVFPSYPEANDENFPRIAIKFGRATISNTGGENFLTETTSDTQVLKSNYGQVMSLTVTIAIFVKKDQIHNVAYSDLTIHPIRNTKQSDYLAGEIQRYLQSSYDEFTSKGITIGNGVNIVPSYEDNDFLFVSEIEVPITIMSFGEVNYSEGSIIAIINKAYTTTQVEA